VVEGSLEVKLPTIWTDDAAQVGRVREEGKKKEDQRREIVRRKKINQAAQKGRKVAKQCVSSMFCGPGGSQSRLAKAAGAETSGQMRDQQLHAAVARSRCSSQNTENTFVPEHFGS